MARPRKEDARDTRQHTLDAALDLFAQSGFSGTSMRQIARAVGVRESALYHHFPSKAAILEELMKCVGPGRAEQLTSMDIDAVVKAHGAEGFLHMVMLNVVDSWSTPVEQKVMRLILREGSRMGRDSSFSPSKWMTRAHDSLSRVFAELVRLKVVREVEPAATAYAFMGPMMMMRLQHLAFHEGEPDYRLIKKVAERQFRHFWDSIKLNERSLRKKRGS